MLALPAGCLYVNAIVLGISQYFIGQYNISYCRHSLILKSQNLLSLYMLKMNVMAVYSLDMNTRIIP